MVEVIIHPSLLNRVETRLLAMVSHGQASFHAHELDDDEEVGMWARGSVALLPTRGIFFPALV